MISLSMKTVFEERYLRCEWWCGISNADWFLVSAWRCTCVRFASASSHLDYDVSRLAPNRLWVKPRPTLFQWSTLTRAKCNNLLSNGSLRCPIHALTEHEWEEREILSLRKIKRSSVTFPLPVLHANYISTLN